MRKSIYRQYAAEYRSLAETARSEEQRSLLLSIAGEWEVLADAAAKRSKRGADDSGLNPIAAKPSYRADRFACDSRARAPGAAPGSML